MTSASERVYESIVSRIGDKKAALKALRLHNAVIRKFGDEITIADFLDQARDAIFGQEHVLQDEDSALVRNETRRVANHWLTGASVGKPSLVDHPDPQISKFGRRMYLELNSGQFTPEKLAEIKKAWGM